MSSLSGAGATAAEMWGYTERLVTARTDSLISLPSTADGILCASTTTAYAYGPWVQVSSGIANNIVICALLVDNTTLYDLDTTVQIGTGDAGSEAAKVQFTKQLDSSYPLAYVNLTYPINIPANTRIAARVSTDGTTSMNIRVSIMYYTV